MKNILLPTDFSDNSIHAIQYATKLFKDVNCTFYVLHVYGVPFLTDQEIPYYESAQKETFEDSLFKQSEKNLKKLIHSFEKNPLHNFKTISDYNFFINSVLKTVENKKIDTVVMGTKGATGAKEIFLGSNTGEVILKVVCDILAIPENTKYQDPKEITFPTDFKISYKKGDLKGLLEIVKLHQAKVHVMHVMNQKSLDELQEKNQKVLTKIFQEIESSFHILTNTNFENALNCFTQSRGNIDMIAIVARHYNIFQRLFFRPIVEKLSFHTNIPLLILHEN